MSKHTPGPWKAEKGEGTNPGWDVYAEDASDYAGEDEVILLANFLTEPDARLIASAPDLLEALEELLEFAPSYPRGGEGEKRVQAARAAVARARGES